MEPVKFRVWATGKAREGQVGTIEGLGRVLLTKRASGAVISDSVRVDVLALEKGLIAFSAYQVRQ